jgi:hypothetical protein
MIDPNDKTWAEVKAHIDARIGESIAALKRRDVSHDESQWLRGRIAELESLLDLAPVRKESPGVDAGVPSY